MLIFLMLSVAAPPDLGAVRALNVPSGLEIAKVAGPPLVDRPVVATIDDKGHLYVADSSGSNEKPDIQLLKKPHRIVRLTDTDGDGVYDKQTIFADQMSFLQGVLWKDGSLYVGAPPLIWKMTDADGDGVAENREVWFDGQTLTGCANDLHGPYDGPDGYLYWTKGAFAKQPMTMEKSGPATRCAMIFRAKPDGSKREVVMTGGMDNPVDVVFLPNGERIFSTTFFQHPANGQRDGLVHAVIGAVYGKDHDPVYELPWTSTTLMPPMTHLGPAAPAGLHRYARDRLGTEFTGNLFCAQFNMRQVSRHIIQPSGSTFKTADSPFVWSEDTDFHPTDVIEDRDGSLLVIDTGGWYKLCCPSSQLVKPDVLGGIYRVRKKEAPRTPIAAPAMPMPELYRIALDRDAKGYDLAVKGLGDKDHQVRRLAAEALGRVGDKRAVPHLLTAMNDPANDRFLMHSLTYALMQIGDFDATKAGLEKATVFRNEKSQFEFDKMTEVDERIVVSLLHALAAIDEKRFAPVLTPYLELKFGSLTVQQQAWMLASRHGNVADAWVKVIESELATCANDRTKPGMSVGLISGPPGFARFAVEQQVRCQRFSAFLAIPSVQRAVLEAMTKGHVDSHSMKNAMDLAASGTLKDLPPAMIDWFVQVLSDPKHPKLHEVGHVLERRKLQKRAVPDVLNQPLEVLAKSDDVELQRFARELLPSKRYPIDETVTKTIMKDHGLGAVEREFRQFQVPDRLFDVVIEKLKTASPSELNQGLSLFEQSRSSSVGLALVKALNTPEMRAKLRVEQIKPILDKYPEAVKKEAEKLYAAIDAVRGDEKAKLVALLKELPSGDIRRGQAIFNAAKANCRACHTIGYVGGKTGPDLTRIGSIRTEADLVESIVYPSASFVRSYEPERFELADGRTLNGNVKSDRGDAIVLTIAADREETIRKADIEKRIPGTVSVMPSGFDQQLSKQELADLVAFLKACR
jgi:putative membrane-bound dehydrogenase-like protein